MSEKKINVKNLKKLQAKYTRKLDSILSKNISHILKYLKPFLLILSIYIISMLSIWRAGISFIDDTGRAIEGYAWNSDFNRYTSTILSRIIQGHRWLVDISPLSQFIALVFLAIASLILTYILCRNKIRYTPLILSAFICICPFAAECWLYKFDSISMAFSILISIAPFLLWSKLKFKENNTLKNNVYIILISTLCLVLMWTSYQAASGIYLIILLALILDAWLNKEKNK